MDRCVRQRSTWLFFILIASLDVLNVHGRDDIEEVYEFKQSELLDMFSWKVLDWAFPNRWSRLAQTLGSRYVPRNAVPFGIEVWKDKLFITVPRWTSGIPAALNYISITDSSRDSPQLIAYPSFEKNVPGVCNGNIITAHRIHVDDCDRLWVLDTGTMVVNDQRRSVCPPSVKVFDLITDRLIRWHELPRHTFIEDTFIPNMAVELDRGICGDGFAYISDEMGRGVTVYDLRRDRSWHRNFRYNYSIEPEPTTEVVYGMAISPQNFDGDRTLYFHPFNGNTEFAVSTRILKNQRVLNARLERAQTFVGTYLGSSTAEIMDDTGIILYTLINYNAIGCWDPAQSKYSEKRTIIAGDDERLIFPNDIKIARGYIWILSNRLPAFSSHNMDFEDVNFRVMIMDHRKALEGTRCEFL